MFLKSDRVVIITSNTCSRQLASDKSLGEELKAHSWQLAVLWKLARDVFVRGGRL